MWKGSSDLFLPWVGRVALHFWYSTHIPNIFKTFLSLTQIRVLNVQFALGSELCISHLRKMFSFPLKMPLQHQDKNWEEVNLVGSYQQRLSGIQPTLHNFIPFFRQSNLMWEKTVQGGGVGEERKENFLLRDEPIFIPSVSAGPSQLTWVSWW